MSESGVLWEVLFRADPAVDAIVFSRAVIADARTLPIPGRDVSSSSEELRALIAASTQDDACLIAGEITDAANDLADPSGELRSRWRRGRGGWWNAGPSVSSYRP